MAGGQFFSSLWCYYKPGPALASKADFTSFLKCFFSKVTVDVPGIVSAFRRRNKDMLNTTQDSAASAGDGKMDLTLLDPLFDKFLKDQEALSGVLNPLVTKKNNESFRKKLTSWRTRK